MANQHAFYIKKSKNINTYHLIQPSDLTSKMAAIIICILTFPLRYLHSYNHAIVTEYVILLI